MRRPGSGAARPSVPMRKAVVAVDTARAETLAARAGADAGHRLHDAGPSSGFSTWATPFRRPKIRLYPPRMTVLLPPKTLPRMPSAKFGFQATATRGLKPP